MASYYYKKSHTLPRKRREFSDSPFKSANPVQLHEVTTNTQLDYVDDASAQLYRTCGVEHPVHARTMKEYDQEISDLKKENFNLKLRIFFLEERMQRMFRSADVEEVHKKNIELQVELESCKKEILDKQKLLMKASETLQGIERQHSADLEKQKRDYDKSMQQLLHEIAELKKDSRSDESAQQRNSIELYRQAFPALEYLQSSVPVHDGTVSIGEEKEPHFIRILEINAELENTVKDQMAQIKKLTESELKSEKTIRGLLQVCKQKTENIECLQESLDAKISELIVLKKRRSEFGEQLTGNEDTSGYKLDNGKSWEYFDMERLNLSKQLASLQRDLRLRDDALLKVKNLLGQLHQDNSNVQFKFLEDFVNMATSQREIASDLINEAPENVSPAKNEIIRLNFKLAATEATVRMLATKTKYFRQVLAESGMLSSAPLGKLHNSESNLYKLGVECQGKSKKFPSTHTLRPLENLTTSCGSSAPATPIISPRFPASSKCKCPTSDSSTQTLEEFCGLIENLRDAKVHSCQLENDAVIRTQEIAELKDKLQVARSENEQAMTQINNLMAEKADFLAKVEDMSEIRRKNQEIEERRDVLVNELQYKELELEQQETEHIQLEKEIEALRSEVKRATSENVDMKEKNCSLEKRVEELQEDAQVHSGTRQELACIRKFAGQSQTGFNQLKQRLEELCIFLESLLKFDANGILDISDLTPQKVMSINYHLNLSRDLTGSLSESMLVLGNLSMCNSLVDLEQSQSFSDNDPASESVQNDTNDNFVLMLQPNGGQEMSSRINGMMEELPTFSINFTPSESMIAAKTNAKNVCNMATTNHLKSLAVKDSSFSESDSWSEPDRNVSLQRMGLDEHVRSPKMKSTCRNRAGLQMDSESGASSELAQLARLQQKRFPKLNFGMRRVRSEDCDARRLQARVQALEGLNDSLRAELKIYYSLQTVVPSTSSETETDAICVKSKLEPAGTNVDGLVEPLKEIAALRKRLEESILGYELLREEFEKRLECMVPSMLSTGKENDTCDIDYKSSCGESAETSDVGHLKALLSEKETFTRDLCEANERLRCTVDMVSGLLSEKETVIRHRGEELQRNQELQTQLTNTNRQLEEELMTISIKISNQERRVAELIDQLQEREAAVHEATEKCSEMEKTMKRLVTSHESEKTSLRNELETAQNDVKGALERLRNQEKFTSELIASHGKAQQKMTDENKLVLDEIRNENTHLRGNLSKMEDTLKSKETLIKVYENKQSEMLSESESRASIDVGQLLTEIKHLRLQLERSIHTNTALRSRLESREGSQARCEQYYSAVVQEGNTNGLQVPLRGPRSIDGQADSNSVYSSPDLGIESDRSQFSSLDCRLGSEINHGWTWPPANHHDMGDQSYVRHTFHGVLPAPSKCELSHENTCSSVNTICSITRINKLADIKMEIIAAMQVLKKMKGKLGGSSESSRCDDLRDVGMNCSSIYKQLKECIKMIEQYEPNDHFENERELMAAQISKLQQQLALQKNICSETARKLRAAVRFKEGMEKAIIKQLSKTHGVLQKARGNLELQDKKS